ncbi:MAG: GGDEF domain-containing protein [Pseudoflavonifractor sp.]
MIEWSIILRILRQMGGDTGVGIKGKKTLVFAAVAAAVFVLLGALYARYITGLLTQESQMHLSEVATQGAASVQRQVARDFDLLEILADGIIADPEITAEKKMQRIKEQAHKFGLFRIGMVDLEGNAITSDDHAFSVADRAFFQSAVKGKRFVSQPILDKVDGVTPGIVYAVPVYHGDKVVSVLFSGYELDKLTQRIDISFYHESGMAFIANSKGEILLHPLEERIGKNLVEVARLRNDAKSVDQFQAALRQGRSGVAHFDMNADNRFFAFAPIQGANDWFLVTSLPANLVFERSQKVILLTVLLLTIISVLLGLIAFYVVVTQRRADAKIVKLAYYDPLTGASNTERFQLDARELFRQCGAQNYSLLNFDVQQFRYLNKDLGYAAGNELLLHIVHCLKSVLQKDETFTRMGTDQFLLLFFSKETEAELRAAVEDLRSKIAAWQPSSGGYYSVQLAFGVYRIEDPEAEIMTSVEKSNIARKAAKVSNSSDLAIYDHALQQKIDRETELERAMPAALENGEFKLYIQPKYDLVSEKIVGGEALVRWRRPDGTLMMPGDFIPLFEQSGALRRMDLYMLGRLCALLRGQLDRGPVPVPISINQSRCYMYRPDYIKALLETLAVQGVPTSLVELEITENLVYTDLEKLIQILEALHQKGFRLSLDDFGSGYSSLNVLKDLPVDMIKLDRFMLREALSSQRGKTVIANIIRMSSELKLSVVAEGVETRDQVLFLRDCGCTTAQGYYYSKPIPAAEFEALLQRQQGS